MGKFHVKVEVPLGKNFGNFFGFMTFSVNGSREKRVGLLGFLAFDDDHVFHHHPSVQIVPTVQQ